MNNDAGAGAELERRYGNNFYPREAPPSFHATVTTGMANAERLYAEALERERVAVAAEYEARLPRAREPLFPRVRAALARRRWRR